MSRDFSIEKFVPNLFNIGELSFRIGVFLISSVLPLGIIFLLFSLLISILKKKINLIKDRWNLVLLTTFGLILFSTFKTLLEKSYSISIDDKLIIIFNAFRWLILFILFPYFQIYLTSRKQRLILIKFFIAGGIPIIISCILQYWFKIYGPFDFFFGLITWYNKPIISSTDGVSGLFSNQNYTGFWLSIIWPFCLTLFLKEKQSKFKKSLYFTNLIFVFYFTIMTTSRSALLGLIISLPLILGLKITIISLLIIILFLIIIYYFNLYFRIVNPNNLLIPDTIKILFIKLSSGNLNEIGNFARIKIWKNTINLILRKPLMGYGAGLFPLFYLIFDNYNAQHSHNFFLQFAFEYGLPTALILLIFAIALLVSSAKKIFNSDTKNKNMLDKAWFAAALVATLSQLIDLTFLDGKISIIILILLSGLKCILNEPNLEKDIERTA